MQPIEGHEFARLMAALGGLPPRPRVAIAVSGGADSLGLAVLVADWARSHAGEPYAIVIDHGLRPASGLEAVLARTRLATLNIPATVLRLRGLQRGPPNEQRARVARHALLQAACRDLGSALLVLAHQASDQAETFLLRASHGSGDAGLAAMAGRRHLRDVVLLRPLLRVPPARIRATLAARGIGWAEDLSNSSRLFERGRIRAARADAEGSGHATTALGAASAAYAAARAQSEVERNRALAAAVTFYPEGFAKLSPGPIPPEALASVIRALSGRAIAPRGRRLRAYARSPHPATLGGLRFLHAGRLGPGLLAVREVSAMAPPGPAIPGVLWDGRFRLRSSACPPRLATLGPVGRAASLLRSFSDLPAAVLATLPALRVGEKLVAVPHIGYPDRVSCAAVPVVFSPAEPAGGVPFFAD